MEAVRKHRFVRSPAGISRASLPQAQHRLSRLLLICRRAATTRGTIRWCDEPSGGPRFLSSAVFSCSQRPCFHVWCVSGNCDETHQTLQQGRQALAHTGRRSLAALAVSRQRALLPSRYVAVAVVARMWSAVAVPSAVAVVAAVRVQLPVSHRLVAPITSPVSALEEIHFET